MSWMLVAWLAIVYLVAALVPGYWSLALLLLAAGLVWAWWVWAAWYVFKPREVQDE